LYPSLAQAPVTATSSATQEVVLKKAREVQCEARLFILIVSKVEASLVPPYTTVF
jgi:hypothetical protein